MSGIFSNKAGGVIVDKIYHPAQADTYQQPGFDSGEQLVVSPVIVDIPENWQITVQSAQGHKKNIYVSPEDFGSVEIGDSWPKGLDNIAASDYYRLGKPIVANGYSIATVSMMVRFHPRLPFKEIN